MQTYGKVHCKRCGAKGLNWRCGVLCYENIPHRCHPDRVKRKKQNYSPRKATRATTTVEERNDGAERALNRTPIHLAG